jgi:hypothetical protein
MNITDFFNYYSMQGKKHYLYIWMSSQCIRLSLREWLSLPHCIFTLDGYGIDFVKTEKVEKV